ncbi:hypothetical protein Tco_0714260, partial [Tanacetum coccineum]
MRMELCTGITQQVLSGSLWCAVSFQPPLESIEPNVLSRQFENSSPYDMLLKLKSMFEKQARVERFDLIQTFYACKQEEGKLVGPYIIKMKGYMEQLERLGIPNRNNGYYFYFPPENKIVVARYADFFEKNLLSQEVSGRAGELEEIQDEDTSPSEITSEIPIEVEGFEPPHEEVGTVRRSARTHRAPESLCLNVEAKEHSLGDINEPANSRTAMLDLESNKWLDAMNA